MAASWPEHKKVKYHFFLLPAIKNSKNNDPILQKVCTRRAEEGFVVVPLEGRGMGCLATRWNNGF